MARSNWYSDHPAACTCAQCADKRTVLKLEDRKIGRNEKCPCGSGKKFKRCHGA